MTHSTANLRIRSITSPVAIKTKQRTNMMAAATLRPAKTSRRSQRLTKWQGRICQWGISSKRRVWRERDVGVVRHRGDAGTRGPLLQAVEMSYIPADAFTAPSPPVHSARDGHLEHLQQVLWGCPLTSKKPFLLFAPRRCRQWCAGILVRRQPNIATISKGVQRLEPG